MHSTIDEIPVRESIIVRFTQNACSTHVLVIILGEENFNANFSKYKITAKKQIIICCYSVVTA